MADDSDRHVVVPRPRPPGLVLRHRPEEPQVRDLDSVGGGVEAGKQEAEEPAHILMQLADEEREQVRRVLPRVQGPRDVPRRGAEGGREEEAEGDLRGHAGQGPLRGLAPQKWKRAAAPMGWRQHGENLGRSTEKTVDKTIGTPPPAGTAVSRGRCSRREILNLATPAVEGTHFTFIFSI